MRIELPELTTILPLILEVESRFEGPPKKISVWVEENRQEIERNRCMVAAQDGSNDIEILLQFLRNLLVRAMKGEAGEQTYRELKAAIRDKSHLRREVYAAALKKANYRWGSDAGADTIVQVVAYFKDELKWNWQHYLELAETHRENNFSGDQLRSKIGRAHV